MSRTVSEWIGKTDDSKAPPKVRDRLFQVHGKTCNICKIAIKDVEGFDLDHVAALINGGENRESNLAPVHRHCHVGKTAIDVKIKAKVAKVRQKHNGSIRPKQTIRSAPFPKTEKAAKREPKQSLPYRPLYRSNDQ